MNEDQKKWLLKLQEKGVMFEYPNMTGAWVKDKEWAFAAAQKYYRIPAQPIPDIPDWRELCREMRRNGVNVEYENSAGSWIGGHLLTVYGEPLSLPIKSYRIPQQPLPEWREELNFEIEKTEYPKILTKGVPEKLLRKLNDPSFRTIIQPDKLKSFLGEEEMHEEQITAKLSALQSNQDQAEETKPDPREEIPHRELQIQWHEDMLHHLRTGELMPVWEYRIKNGDGEWKVCHDPHFSEKYQYRRKPRTVKYWHCVGVYIGYQDNGVVDREVFSSDCSASDVQSQIDTCKENYPSAKFSQITETTVEMDD